MRCWEVLSSFLHIWNHDIRRLLRASWAKLLVSLLWPLVDALQYLSSKTWSNACYLVFEPRRPGPLRKCLNPITSKHLFSADRNSKSQRRKLLPSPLSRIAMNSLPGQRKPKPHRPGPFRRDLSSLRCTLDPRAYNFAMPVMTTKYATMKKEIQAEPAWKIFHQPYQPCAGL